MKKIVTIAAISIFLSGHAFSNEVDSVTRLRETKIEPSGHFDTALAIAYRQLVVEEVENVVNFGEIDVLARKGVRLLDGDMVPPEEINDHPNISAASAAELASARRLLVKQLENRYASFVNAVGLAEAQVSFDCWVVAADLKDEDTLSRCFAVFHSAIKRNWTEPPVTP